MLVENLMEGAWFWKALYFLLNSDKQDKNEKVTLVNQWFMPSAATHSPAAGLGGGRGWWGSVSVTR